jgi:SAM-dependent methyltransferase
MGLDRKALALSGVEHLYWLHFRTLEPFIINHLSKGKAPLLDLGCGNKPYRKHYPQGEAVGADVSQSSLGCVDVIIEPGSPLPFADATFQTILCTQVLEHVDDPHLLISEAARLLRPEGKMILTVPFIWELHERPHDFLRFSEYWLSKYLSEAGFELELLERQGGDLATVGQLICLSLAVRQIHMPRWMQKLYNRFWAFLDRRSHTDCMPLNYGIVCVKSHAATPEPDASATDSKAEAA